MSDETPRELTEQTLADLEVRVSSVNRITLTGATARALLHMARRGTRAATLSETHRGVLEYVVKEFAQFAGSRHNWPIVGPHTAAAIQAALDALTGAGEETP